MPNQALFSQPPDQRSQNLQQGSHGSSPTRVPPTFVFFFSAFWPHPTAGRIPVPLPGIEPVLSAVKVRCLNHWTAREVPAFVLNEASPSVALGPRNPAVSHSTTLQTAITPLEQPLLFQTLLQAWNTWTEQREQLLKDRRWSQDRKALMQLPEPGNLDGTWEQVREAATLTHENQVPGLLSCNEVAHPKKCGIITVIIKLWVMWEKLQHRP